MNFQAARDFRFEPVSHSYLRRDGMRYAPGLSYGSDPLAPEQLDFVCERSRVIPPNSQTGCPATFRGMKERVSAP